MVLSACSSYFEKLFVNFSEPNQIVILKDTSFVDIAAIVDFMYKGEINVSQVGQLLSEESNIWKVDSGKMSFYPFGFDTKAFVETFFQFNCFGKILVSLTWATMYNH